MEQKTHRKRLGLLITNLATTFALDRCRGADQAARETDCDLIVFPGVLPQVSLENLQKALPDIADNSLYEFAARFHLDALLVCLGCIANDYDSEKIETLLSHLSGIPTILMDAKTEDFRCIATDSAAGVEAELEHLISFHGCRHICFVGGPENNYDAQSREQAYLDVMARHDLPVSPEMMVNGHFSEHCDAEVAHLLNDNPDVDAILCANDLMATCVYRLLKLRGLLPRKDIAVVAYDDAPPSCTMDPPLTTVRNCSFEIGYHAVFEAQRLLAGEAQQVFALSGHFVVRASCGCPYHGGFGGFLMRFLPLRHETVAPAAWQIAQLAFRVPTSDPVKSRALPVLTQLITQLLADINNPLVAEFQTLAQTERIRTLVSLCDDELASGALQNALDVLFRALSDQVSDPVRKNSLLIFSMFTRQQLFDYTMRSTRKRDAFLEECRFHISRLQHNALFVAPNHTSALQYICGSLRGMGMRNAALLTFPMPLPAESDAVWSYQGQLHLAARLNEGRTQVPQTAPALNVEETMDQLTSARRITWTAFCLSTDQELLGLLLCEDNFANYYNDYMVGMQISTIIKYLFLEEQRRQIQSQLTDAMEIISRKNEMLQMLSTVDPLTGILNRRGFLEQMQSLILHHSGASAAVCMLDLDNLKSINDTFGHAEGDFAISQFVRVVQQFLQPGDLFARYGGDEFILLLSDAAENRLRSLPQQIRAAFEQYNASSSKPFYIEASYGVTTFQCRSNTRLETLMSGLDAQLYASKQGKRLSALKTTDNEPPMPSLSSLF